MLMNLRLRLTTHAGYEYTSHILHGQLASGQCGKDKSSQFQERGAFRKGDILYYEGRDIEFVPKFTYLGVMVQTKGWYSGHIQNLK